MVPPCSQSLGDGFHLICLETEGHYPATPHRWWGRTDDRFAYHVEVTWTETPTTNKEA